VATQAQVPDHVPAHLVVDFDIKADTQFGARWQEGAAALFQRHGPVFWTPRYGGHWVVGGYDAVVALARDTAHFSSDPWIYPPLKGAPRMLPINLDPPEHGIYRHPLNAAFGPSAVLAIRDKIRGWADRLIDGFVADGRVDIVPGFAERFPVGVMLDLLGLPYDRADEFRSLMREIVTAPSPQEWARCIERVGEICKPLVELNLREPQDTVIGRLARHSFGGRAITFDELLGYCILIFAAGLDTVVNSLGFGIMHLAQDQALQQRLRANPKLIPRAMEEFLRRYSIVNFHRTVTEDFAFFGAPMKRFDRVTYMTAAANLDPQAYTDPLEIRLDRMEKPHQAFHSGPHRCAGFNLARIEMTVAYEQVLKRLPPFRLDPERPVEIGTGTTFCLASAPLVWDAAG